MAKQFVHPYLPNSVPAIKEEMLKAIGVSQVEDIYHSVIPEELLFKGKMDLPDPIVAEAALKKHVLSLLSRNKSCDSMSSFLGAGCYHHYVPAICDEINSRAEFLTAYCGDTYSDHGKQQAIFEYTSLMAELLDLDVVSYTTYDASQSLASSLRMALRIQEAEGKHDRRVLLLPSTMNPELFSQASEYCKGVGDLIRLKADPMSLRIDLEDLSDKLRTHPTAAIFYENPSYLGFLETGAKEIAELAHKHGALVIAQADVASLGVIESPANYGADIVCGDIQPLGMHMQYGGGCAGFIATPYEKRFIQQYPTYLYGITTSKNPGEYGFGRALNERTSHGAREKAKEFFGTETGLWSITAAVYLSLMGPQGMRELGENILQICQYARKELSKINGIKLLPQEGYWFQEFILNFDQCDKTVADINRRLLDFDILGGKDLSGDFPELGQSALYAVTELTTVEEIKKVARALEEITGA